jgi:hypothetical protein
MKYDEMAFSKKYLLGALAKWSVNQSPYYVPDNLETVLRKVSDLLPTSMFNDEIGIYKIMKKSVFNVWFLSILMQVPELVRWNRPKNGTDPEFVFCSAFDKPSPDADIVDLDALVGNIKWELIEANEE